MPIWKSNIIPKATKVQLATAVHDALAAGIAYVGAFFLRLGDDAFPIFMTSSFWVQCIFFIVLAILISRVMGLNRGLWRYASVPDMIAIVKTGVLTTLVFSVGMFMVDRLVSIPRTAPIISCVLLIFFLGASRIGYRLWRNRRELRLSTRGALQPVVLIGSGDGADLFIRAVNERRDMTYQVLAVFDDSGRRSGLKIRDVKIFTDNTALVEMIAEHNAEGTPISAFVLTKPISELPRALVDQLIDLGAEHGIELKQLPSFDTPDSVDRAGLEPRAVKIEDLLARPSVMLDTKGLDRLLQGRTVVVTGAGGSIGSQLCREIIAFKPSTLALLDACEFNLYNIDKEMRTATEDMPTKVTSLLCNVRQGEAVARIFNQIRPEIVFHAAALKHVPIVQNQPVEGLHTNVLGSRNVIDAAIGCQARAMVMISTDKAVNPTSVMGASKRAAELYCQTNDLNSDTRCVIVRFGNVLGSTGSVVPHFKKQIQAGGPVTVTHQDITRYFMTIPEASQLVLQAANLAVNSDDSRGQVHVLDMGEPIKIVSLAKKMITLSGLRPGVDIEIVYSGLRAGEKLYEELFSKDEQLVGSKGKGILIATPPIVSEGKIQEFLAAVNDVVASGDSIQAVQLLSELIPEAKIVDIDHLLPEPVTDTVVRLPTTRH